MITTITPARRLPIRSLSGSATVTLAAPWVRNSEWPALPTLVDGDQKFVGLYAVFDTDSNFLAVQVSGDYTVDWGDGVTENFSSGVKADHKYTYSSISGSAISLGYKIVIVTITPQAGQNLTSIYLNKRHNTQLSVGSTGWLDIALNAPNATVIDIGGSSSNTTLLVRHSFLEQVYIRQHAITSTSSMFQNCISLVSVPAFSTGAVNNMSSMFYNCISLVSVPAFSTGSVTTMSNMFYNCYSLVSVPAFSTGSVMSMSGMFYGCVSLVSVPAFSTGSVTNMSSMFLNCYSLVSVPAFSTGAVTSMSSMFYGCFSLVSVPALSTGSVTNMSSMFLNCYSLASVPAFSTGSVTNMSSMFNNCYSLVSAPAFSTGAVTNMSSMFLNCYSLVSVPSINQSAISSTTNSASIFSGCYSLARMLGYGIRYALDLTGCNLTATAINEILANLGAPSGGAQTITVKTNPGSATCNTSLAPSGWTVVIA